VHGIGPAARHYFGLNARRLTPRQACFLAAIIPSPNRAHRLVAAGLGERTFGARVDDLLLRLNGFQVVTDEALELGLQAPLHFAFGAPGAEDGAQLAPLPDGSD
jgi:membrane carboxypeptidase/penicillin-binding protein PbpC